MKRTFWLIFALFCFRFGNAQIEFGVKAGLNLSRFRYSGSGGYDPAYKTSFNAGVLALLPVARRIYLQPEIVYSGQGYEETLMGQSTQTEAGYLNIPVLLKYQDATGVFVEAGPQAGINLSARQTISDISGSIKKDFKSADFSAVLGLGYKFIHSGLGIDARYNLGLTAININKQRGTFKNSVFQFGLFYLFRR